MTQYITPQQYAVRKTIARTLNKKVDKEAIVMDFMVSRTAEAFILMVSYIAYRTDLMQHVIEGSTPFVNKLRNRVNQVVRSCDEFIKVMEPFIGEDKRKDYVFFSDVVFTALDSLLDDMHREPDTVPPETVRRAKLRYHDPYREHVRECTAAFEDGYCKGYTDCVDDIKRELIRIESLGDGECRIDIEGGKCTINQVKQ